MNELYRKLDNLGACEEILNWVNNNNIQTPWEAWERCEQADWMLWLCMEMAGQPGWSTTQEVRTVVRWCASTVLHLWDAPEVVRRYLETGDGSIRDAAATAAARASASYVALDVASYAAATAAFDAASYAAAATAAFDAAYAYAAAYVYAAAYAYAAHHKKMCNHIRKTLKIGELK